MKALVAALSLCLFSSCFALYPTGSGGLSCIFENIGDPTQSNRLHLDLQEVHSSSNPLVTSRSAGTDYGVEYEAFTASTGNILKAYSSTKSLSGTQDITTEGQAFFDENILIDSPGLTGQFGNMIGTINVSGTFFTHSEAGGKNARARVITYQYYEGPDNGYALYPNGTFTLLDDHRVVGDGLGDVTENVNRTITYNFRFQYGTEFHIGLNILARTRVFGTDGQAEAYAISDFSHSLRWGGVDAITDQNGSTITIFSLSTASGTNLLKAAPVPEPGTLALCSLGALVALKRKRKSD